MPKWSLEQEKAIDTIDKSVLVSAAAGSGKTAVLVERIKKLVIEKNVDVDSLLVVTFTKAAAAEMRERIVKELKKTIVANPNAANVKALKKQLTKINNSDISTIHSFASKIIKKYFYMLDLDSNFKMGDETVCKLIKKECMDEVFHDLHKEKNEDFLNFIASYSKITNSKALKEDLIFFYEKIMSMAKPFEFLSKAVESYTIDENQMGNGEIFSHIFDYGKIEINKALRLFEKNDLLFEEDIFPKLKLKSREELMLVKHLAEGFEEKDFNKVRIMLKERKFATMSPSKPEKEPYELISEESKFLRKEGKNIIANLEKRYFYTSLEEMAKTINETKNTLLTIEKIIIEFHNFYSRAKREKNILDFNDLEHFALKILENEDVREEYRNKFKYIFVDEYQDTNPVQEKMISSIERGDNTFRVGDIKQCIYGFRMSDPTLFRQRYIDYRNGEKDSCKIDLNKNFRSKGLIIESINRIFEKAMEDYDEDARLNRGLEENSLYEFPVELHCIYDEEEGLHGESEETDEIDEELQELNKLEIEALLISKIIKENLGQEIYDEKLGKVRKITERDIVILYRSGKYVAETMKSVLESQDISAYVEENKGYFETLEVSMVTELLKVIDNRKKDVALIATLRTDFFKFTTNELLEIRFLSPKGYFYDGVVKYADKGEEEGLRDKCRRAIEFFEKWKKKSFAVPINEVAWELMVETGIYDYVGAMKSGDKRQGNLRAFIDRANKYIENGDGTVYGFLQYIDLLKEREIEIGQVALTSENDNVVRIMTIHKSKGLEFPVVIIPNLSKKLIKQGKKDLLEIDKDLGVGIYMSNHKEHTKKDTIIQRMIADRNIAKMREEEIRILYVAFTRAKDKLILLGTLKNQKNLEVIGEDIVAMSKSFMDLLFGLREHGKMKIQMIGQSKVVGYAKEKKEEEKEGLLLLDNLQDLDNLENAENAENTENAGDSDNLLKKEEEREIVDKRLSFEYESSEAKLISKTSVSNINSGESIERIKIQSPEMLGNKTENIGMIVGTVNHTFLEHIDFKNAKQEGQKYLREQKEILARKNIINAKWIEYVMLDKIEKLLKNSIFDRLINSNTVKKEQEFTILFGKEDNEQLVQGVVDCFFEEDGELVLLDYKTNADVSNLEEKYQVQMEIYKKALEINYGKRVKESYLVSIGKGEIYALG